MARRTRAANCAAAARRASASTPPRSARPSSPHGVRFTQGLSSGNPDLSEETAKTWTAGVVLRPSFLPGFTVTADWYDIRIQEAINTPEAEDVADLCVDQPTLGQSVLRRASRAMPATASSPASPTRPENVAAFTTAGLDMTMTLRRSRPRPSAHSTCACSAATCIDLTYGRLARSRSRCRIAASNTGRATSATFDLTWRKGPLTVNYNVDWQDKTKRFADDIIRGDPDYVASKFLFVKEKWEHAAQFDFDVREKIFGLRRRATICSIRSRSSASGTSIVLLVSGVGDGPLLITRGRRSLSKAPPLIIGGIDVMSGAGTCRAPRATSGRGWHDARKRYLYMARSSQWERSAGAGCNTSICAGLSGPTYVTLIALAFLGLGIWVGARLFHRAPAVPFEKEHRGPATLGISARELEVLELLAAGQSNKEIASQLEVSPNTVKTHVAKLFEKLEVRRRTEAILRARELGMIR